MRAPAAAMVAPMTVAFPTPESPRERPAPSGAWLSAFTRRILGIPLVAKLLGANTLIVIAALTVHGLVGAPSTITFVAALVLGFAINTLLVRLALVPLDELERVAQAVSERDLTARAVILPTADRQVARLADAFNRLLARVAADRAQIQHLVRSSLRARETERAQLARQLRDSTAQQLSAITLQLGAAVQTNSDPALAPLLSTAHAIASGLSDEVRRMADSVYPGLLGRFGLYPALESLGSRMRERSGLEVVVDTHLCQTPLPLGITTALYGVAEEALRNVEQHASAHTVRLSLALSGSDVELRIEDDGLGFDAEAAEHAYGGIGLFRARELLAHCGGELRVVSIRDKGTKVIATAVVQDRE